MPRLSTLNYDDFARLETAVRRERARRDHQPVALSGDAVNREVTRLQHVRAARRAVLEIQYEERLTRFFEQRLEELESGKGGFCACRACLAGYVTRDVNAMCETGQRQCLKHSPWNWACFE